MSDELVDYDGPPIDDVSTWRAVTALAPEVRDKLIALHYPMGGVCVCCDDVFPYGETGVVDPGCVHQERYCAACQRKYGAWPCETAVLLGIDRAHDRETLGLPPREEC